MVFQKFFVSYVSPSQHLPVKKLKWKLPLKVPPAGLSQSCLFLLKCISRVREYNSKINSKLIESNKRARNEYGCLLVLFFRLFPHVVRLWLRRQ